MQIKRLQGKEFSDRYNKLIEVAYSISNNGNICKFYRYPYATKVTVSHWLNDDEKNYKHNHPNRLRGGKLRAKSR